MEPLLAVFVWFVAILTLSTITINIYRQVRSPGLKIALDVLLFIGVVIHELAHAISLLCMGVVPVGFSVRYRDRSTHVASPHGYVKHKRSDDLKLSFVQGFFTALAPLYVSTFTFLFMLDVIFNTNSPDTMKLAAGIVMVSVILGSAPSNADINGLIKKYKRNPAHAWYQLLLTGLAVLLTVSFIDLSFLVLPFKVMYYILYCLVTILMFLGLKLAMLTLKTLVRWSIRGVQKRTTRRRTVLLPPDEYYRSEFNPIEEVDR